MKVLWKRYRRLSRKAVMVARSVLITAILLFSSCDLLSRGDLLRQFEAPVADAGSDITITIGPVVVLDGSESNDPDGDPLTYSWYFISLPAGSMLSDTDINLSNTDQPEFTPDAVGSYVLVLMVSDGESWRTDRVTVVVNPANIPPTADAGPDAPATVGSVITLNGSGSYDDDGDPITYAWTFISIPALSTLSDADIAGINSATPSFTPDADGIYQLQLTVNDGTDTDTDTVVIYSGNVAPVADAGADQNLHTGGNVILDGTATYDINGDFLTFFWTFLARPAGSTATLSDTASATPTFVSDISGTYELQLTVDDGTVSSSDTVIIYTSNTAPVADAGTDQAVVPLVNVTLDGGGSSDADSDPLTYLWTFDSVPGTSGITAASLSSQTAITPSFIPDIAGTYTLTLTVDDGIDTATDTVDIIANNPPTADAGPNATHYLNSCISLDGSASSDPDGDILTYTWTFQTLAGGSGLDDVDIFHSTTEYPYFFPDVAGDYILELGVGDGIANDIATVTITVEHTELVGEWMFDSGDASDTGPYGNNGLVENAVLCEDREGNTDRAYYFNGINSSINLGNDLSLNYTDVLSLSCWIRPDVLVSDYGRIISKRNTPAVEGWEVSVGTGDSLTFVRGDTSMAVSDPAGMTEGSWHHIVFTWDPNATESDDQFRFYIDGMHAIASVFAGAETEYMVSAQSLTLGMAAYGASYFTGAIDDVRFYHGILDQTDVDELYTEIVNP